MRINRMMKNRNPNIPLEDQFLLATAAACVVWGGLDTKSILESFGYEWERERKNIKRFLTFTNDQLLDFYQQHPDFCKIINLDSSDKRFSPSTFITVAKNGKYIVGIYRDGYQEVQEFDALAEATTDYVLFTLGMPRLNQKEN